MFLTVEQFETYDVADDMRAELVRGELRLIPPPGFRHSAVIVRLAVRLHAFVEANRLGVVGAGGGYQLLDLPRTVRAPDLAFVRADRLPPGDLQAGLARLVPDLAIEIRSPSEDAGRLEEKLADYRAAGVPLVWVIDPERRTAMAVIDGVAVPELGDHDLLDGGVVLPGFTCRVEELFER